MDMTFTRGSTPFYIGLSSTQPTENGTGVTEPTGSDYMRARITAFSTPRDGVVYNSSPITFNRSRTEWFAPDAKAQYWVLFDGDGKGAHVLASGSLDKAITVMMNTDVVIAANSLGVTLIDIP